MRLWLVLRVAVRALVRNAGRSLLTVLGIIIGVAAVIAMVAIGEGARVKVKETFSAMGLNLLIVQSGSTSFGGAHGGAGSLPTITMDDVEAIRGLPAVRQAVVRPEVKAQLVSDEANWSTDLGGAVPEFFEIRIWPIALGRHLTQADVSAGAKVMILGQTVAAQLFPSGGSPLGRLVRVRNVPFTVVGVLAHKGQTPGGWDLDDNAYVPQTTYRAKIQGGMRNLADGVIYVRATAEDDAAIAEQRIAELLRDRHHIAPGMEDDFQVRNMVAMASAQDDSARTMRTLLAAVAAVSLLIAGIGIMNVMLVSVTERTREIGLRIAVGARGRDILWQFLGEALLLSLVGGALGVVVGVGSSRGLSGWFGWPLLLPPSSIAAAVGTSAAVGILFGLYPAWRAATLDPIDALRYE
jgi:putative ABC transport system permease protein